MATKINSQDRAAMRLHTMACWWPTRYFPKESPVWSGIANELGALVIGAERRDDIAEAREMARLRRIAEEAQRAEYSA